MSINVNRLWWLVIGGSLLAATGCQQPLFQAPARLYEAKFEVEYVYDVGGDALIAWDQIMLGRKIGYVDANNHVREFDRAQALPGQSKGQGRFTIESDPKEAGFYRVVCAGSYVDYAVEHSDRDKNEEQRGYAAVPLPWSVSLVSDPVPASVLMSGGNVWLRVTVHRRPGAPDDRAFYGRVIVLEPAKDGRGELIVKDEPVALTWGKGGPIIANLHLTLPPIIAPTRPDPSNTSESP